MSKRRKVVYILISVFVVALSFGAGFLTSRLTLDRDVYDLDFIIKTYKKYYYEQESNLIGVFADDILDAYSAYYTKEEYELIKKTDAGGREGVGLTADANLYILSVNGNSPAQKAGVKAGGKILAVKRSTDQEYQNVATLSEINAFLSEREVDEPFEMQVDYGGAVSLFTLSKREYTQTFVRYSDSSGEYGFSDESGSMKFVKLSDGDGNTENGVSYIKYDGFSGTGKDISVSLGQFALVMQKYKDSGNSKLILDLRDNGGGFLYIMQGVCKYFVGAEKNSRADVCIAKGNSGLEDRFTSEPIKYQDYRFDRLMILCNAGSASATEAFIGAALDYDDNDVVTVLVEGGKTYGKGIMQSTYENPRGGALKLTTAKLYWPKSLTCIHGVGITTALNETFGDKIIQTEKGQSYSTALWLCR